VGSIPSSARAADTARLARPATLVAGLAGLLALALLLGVGIGAVPIAPSDALRIVGAHLGVVGGATDPQQGAVLWVIRLPRVLLGLLVGGGLAVAGAALQGMFRNPLADPGLIGVSSGASVGAVAAIAAGASAAFPGALQLAAFAGGIAAALVVYALARYDGRTEAMTLLLTGIAVTAICGAVVGFLIARLDDDRLRDAVFWSLGSLGSATWHVVGLTVPFVALGALVALRAARSLDLLTLGEREAAHLGVDTERLRLRLVVALALATGAAVAAAGVVSFVGLVVPHLVRLVAGPSHRVVVPASFLGGGALLVLADLVARTAAAPVEIPLGVVTAFAGGPFFLFLIWRTRRLHGGWG
jgi:iron complex transport system permease protein